MTYKNRKCDRCGILDKDFYKKVPKWTYLNPNPLWTMYIGHKGEYWCGPCHKENELEKLFKLWDEVDNRRKARGNYHGT